MSRASESYWERAGALGYSDVMYAAPEVARHVTSHSWEALARVAESLGLGPNSRVLDVGCGDGALANTVLARRFRSAKGIDICRPAVDRARAGAVPPNVRFEEADATAFDFSAGAGYDGAFLVGFLHHVRPAAPAILRAMRPWVPRVAVLEPNGDHPLRKLLELTPSYRAAGDESFGARALKRLFEEAGYRCVLWRRINLFPNFTPGWALGLLRPLETLAEGTTGLRFLCTAQIGGFVADDHL